MPFPRYFFWFLLNLISVFGSTTGQETDQNNEPDAIPDARSIFFNRIKELESIIKEFKREQPFDNETLIKSLVNATTLIETLPSSISFTAISLRSYPNITLPPYILRCENESIEIEYELSDYQYSANFADVLDEKDYTVYSVNVTFHSLRVNINYTNNLQFMKVGIVAGKTDMNLTSCLTKPVPDESLIKEITNIFVRELGRITYEKFDTVMRNNDSTSPTIIMNELKDCLKPSDPNSFKFTEKYNSTLIGTYPRKIEESDETEFGKKIHFSVDDVRVDGLLIWEMLKIECQSSNNPCNVTTTLNNLTGTVKWSYGLHEDNQTTTTNNFTIDNWSLNVGYLNQEFKNLSRKDIPLSLDFVKNAKGCPESLSFFEPVLLDEIKRVITNNFLTVIEE